jgi:alpha-1,2-mannosyltransferase
VIGFAVLPVASLDYWGSKFPGPEVGAYRVQNQSINGVVLRLLHGQAPAQTVWLVAAAVILAFGVATAVLASMRGHELLGIVLCGVTALLVSPISWSHHWVWAVPGLAVMAVGAGGGGASRPSPAGIRPHQWAARTVGAAAIVALFVMWPAPTWAGRVTEWFPTGFLRFAPHNNGKEYAWHGATLLLGNSYVAAGFAALAGAAVYLWVTRRPARSVPAAHATGDHLTSAPQRRSAGAAPQETTAPAVPVTGRWSARNRS